jgi:AraC family transcriptional regulator
MDDQRATAFEAYLGSNASTGPDYVVSDAEGRPIAAKWRRPASRSRLSKLGQNVLMYHIGGSTSVSMFIKGKCQGTGSQHGSLTFRPHDLELESVRSGVFEMLHLYLDQDFVNLYAQQNLVGAQTVDIDPFFAIRDPWLQGYFTMLVSEFELYGGIDRNAHSLLLAQSQQLVVRHLVHWHSNAMLRSRRATGNSGPAHPLSPRRLQAVFEFIDANLSSEIDLADLAALTGLSTNHFIRAFRAATQRTPYGYVVARRLLRVSEALQRSDLPLAEIALSAGFRNLSTLSNTFKRHHGVTPSAYRARLR